jgi:hypothetical protein
MVVACIALVVALGGTAYAVSTLPPNSVGTKQIRDGAVTSRKLKNGVVGTSKIANLAVTKAKLNLTGVTVPTARRADAAATASNALALGGKAANSFSPRLGVEINSATNPPTVTRGSAVTVEGPSQLLDPGLYRIKFNRDVHGCVGVATVADHVDGSIPPAGEVSVSHLDDNIFPDSMIVQTYDSAGNAVSTLGLRSPGVLLSGSVGRASFARAVGAPCGTRDL